MAHDTNSDLTNECSRPVGVIGLGLLGSALAERLLKHGYPTVVNDRIQEKAVPLLEMGAHWSDNPLAECDCVVICLYTTEIVEQVLEQMQNGFHDGLIIVDTTTGDPSQTTALGAKLAERGITYLEAPIAASSDQTRRGEALSMVGGPTEAYVQCLELIRCLAPKSHLVGHWGSASKTKLVNNLVLGLTRIALAEGLAFAEAVGLDPGKTLEVLKQGNAYSVVMDVKGRKMVEGDFSLQAKLSQHLKDIRIVLEEGQAANVALPLSQLHVELLERAMDAGLGDLDNSAVIRLIKETKPQDVNGHACRDELASSSST